MLQVLVEVTAAGATESRAKRRLDLEYITVLGAELLGRRGYVGAPRARRRALQEVTLGAVDHGIPLRRLVQVLSLSWTTCSCCMS